MGFPEKGQQQRGDEHDGDAVGQFQQYAQSHLRFAGRSPFSFSAIDIKTYAMAMLKRPYRECSKRRMPSRWFDELPHTHVAVDDAIEQGAMFCNMLAEHTRNE